MNNLHLKLNDNGILENATEQVDAHLNKEEDTKNDDEEKKEQEEEVFDKEDQETVPSATEKAEGCSTREQEEVPSKGEAEREKGNKEEENEVNDASEVEVSVPVQK